MDFYAKYQETDRNGYPTGNTLKNACVTNVTYAKTQSCMYGYKYPVEDQDPSKVSSYQAQHYEEYPSKCPCTCLPNDVEYPKDYKNQRNCLADCLDTVKYVNFRSDPMTH